MLGFLLGILTGALFYFKILRPLTFWKEKEVRQVPPWPLVGNMGPFVMKTKHLAQITDEIYKNHPDDRYVGYMQFTRPILLLRDLDLIKQIVVKEFDHFHDHLSSEAMKDELLSKSLIRLSGSEWRRMRATLSPAFTGSRIKDMHQLMNQVASNFVTHFKDQEQVMVEMKDVFSRFANDVIASTAFGISVNFLAEPNYDFFQMGKRLSTENTPTA